jgi:DtxR family Mn-dependent transcriptional regulator
VIEPLVALVVGLSLLGLAWIVFRPDYGLWSRWRQTRITGARILREDALKHLHTCEMEARRPTVHSLAGALQVTVDEVVRVLSELESHGLVHLEGGEIQLTPDGREGALHIMRAHRLLERYLADETGYEAAEWHERAEQLEHHLTPQEADDLSARLGHPSYDPHGDPIPTAEGELAPQDSIPLVEAEVDQALRIVHLEDEPRAVYAQIIAEDLSPGMVVRVINNQPNRLRFWAAGEDHVLAPIVAANIFVQPIPKLEEVVEAGVKLSRLSPGEQGRILEIAPHCRGLERRRLLDLGFLPGTTVSATFANPGGDPKAYIIRDTVIALREEQASCVRIEKTS